MQHTRLTLHWLLTALLLSLTPRRYTLQAWLALARL